MKIMKHSLSRRETALIIIFVILVFFLACWRYLVFPLWQSAFTLRNEQTALLHEQKEMLEQLRRQDLLYLEWEHMQNHASSLHTALPSPDRLPQVLSRLEALFDAFAANIHSLQIGKFEHEEAYSALRVKLIASGETAPLLILLKDLEYFEHILLVEQLNWTQNDDHTAVLNLSFRLVFYTP